jgi:hypothetical protein
MSKGQKTKKKIERANRKRAARKARMVHKVRQASSKVAGRTKLKEREMSGNIGDYKNYLFDAINMPHLARLRILELRGHKHQYTSKCPRERVDKYIASCSQKVINQMLSAGRLSF